MKISYKKLIKILLEKSIIGIGENNHGSNCFFEKRIEIINSLYQINNNIIIALEESNKNLQESNITELFPMHQSIVFMKFCIFCKNKKIPIVGIDNYTGDSGCMRNKYMANNILKLNKENPNKIIIFLAFNSHISKYNKSMKPNKESQLSGYNCRKDTGYYLHKELGTKYFSLAIIMKYGKTLGKKIGDYKYKTFSFSNTKNIQKISEGIYFKHKNLIYSGMGPFYYDKYETKWHDSFIIIENCKYQHILSKRKKLPQIISY
tara:strand:+ start:7341 stop:8126 length:786 start_codon:yes stop_codon:yes gene_type:complete